MLPTGCLLAAIVRHEVSRAAEPHLHSRVLVVNATLAASGTWRTLYSLPLYVGARQAGIRYQQALAGYAGSLGYDIAWRANDTCELDAVPRELSSLFSSRTKALEQRLARRGLDRRTASGKQREHATRQAEAARVHRCRASSNAGTTARLRSRPASISKPSSLARGSSHRTSPIARRCHGQRSIGTPSSTRMEGL